MRTMPVVILMVGTGSLHSRMTGPVRFMSVVSVIGLIELGIKIGISSACYNLFQFSIRLEAATQVYSCLYDIDAGIDIVKQSPKVYLLFRFLA